MSSIVTRHLSDRVTVHLGECRDLLREPNAVNVIITDPPYDRTTHKCARTAKSRLRPRLISRRLTVMSLLRSRMSSARRRSDGWFEQLASAGVASAPARNTTARGNATPVLSLRASVTSGDAVRAIIGIIPRFGLRTASRSEFSHDESGQPLVWDRTYWDLRNGINLLENILTPPSILDAPEILNND